MRGVPQTVAGVSRSLHLHERGAHHQQRLPLWTDRSPQYNKGKTAFRLGLGQKTVPLNTGGDLLSIAIENTLGPPDQG